MHRTKNFKNLQNKNYIMLIMLMNIWPENHVSF